MRWVALIFLAVCIMVPVGFYFQAHTNFRSRARLEPYPELRYPRGTTVRTNEPVAVCKTKVLCAEARRMTNRVRRAKEYQEKDRELAKEWFVQLKDDIIFAEEVLVLSTEDRYFSEVRVESGPHKGFQGFVFTVALEESAIPAEGTAPKPQAASDSH